MYVRWFWVEWTWGTWGGTGENRIRDSREILVRSACIKRMSDMEGNKGKKGERITSNLIKQNGMETDEKNFLFFIFSVLLCVSYFRWSCRCCKSMDPDINGSWFFRLSISHASYDGHIWDGNILLMIIVDQVEDVSILFHQIRNDDLYHCDHLRFASS